MRSKKGIIEGKTKNKRIDQNNFLNLLQPINGPLGPQKAKITQDKVKSNVRIEKNTQKILFNYIIRPQNSF